MAYGGWGSINPRVGDLPIVSVTGISDGMTGLVESVLEQCASYSAGDMALLSNARLSSGVIVSGTVVTVAWVMTAELVGMAKVVMRDVMG